MYCRTDQSCESDFYLGTVDSFTLEANADDAVSGVIIYAQNMSSTSSLIINCNAIGSCSDSLHIHAPDIGGPDVILNCYKNTSCSSVNFFIPSISYDQLQVTCSTNTACKDMRFNCLDSFWPAALPSYWPQFYGELTYNAAQDAISCYAEDYDEAGCCPIDWKWGPTPRLTGFGGSITYDCVKTYQCESAVLDFSAYGMYCVQGYIHIIIARG